ncbi:WxPxxD family membrane protein [Bacillus rubiinfantis]|uniref:WxPxxD family membrane protein n=1 Tax=Bacillus rubiinfantis TaxID=1499680 RepID=UPI0005A98F5A|nr:WxPxxD family membrane protein [Bacillus rubiinfantis]
MRSNFSKIIVILITLVYYISIWKVLNDNHVMAIKDVGEQYPFLLYISASMEGYLSSKRLFIYNSLPFVFFLLFYINSESSVVVTRYKSRMAIYWKRSSHIFFISMLFTLIILLINLIGGFIYDYKTCIQSNYILFTFVNFLNLTLIYFSIGVLYYIVFDFFHSSVPIALVTAFLICVSVGFGSRYFQLPWSPQDDANLIDPLLTNLITLKRAFIIILKEMMVALILLIIGMMTIEKKDFSLWSKE